MDHQLQLTYYLVIEKNKIYFDVSWELISSYFYSFIELIFIFEI